MKINFLILSYTYLFLSSCATPNINQTNINSKYKNINDYLKTDKFPEFTLAVQKIAEFKKSDSTIKVNSSENLVHGYYFQINQESSYELEMYPRLEYNYSSWTCAYNVVLPLASIFDQNNALVVDPMKYNFAKNESDKINKTIFRFKLKKGKYKLVVSNDNRYNNTKYSELPADYILPEAFFTLFLIHVIQRIPGNCLNNHKLLMLYRCTHILEVTRPLTMNTTRAVDQTILLESTDLLVQLVNKIFF